MALGWQSPTGPQAAPSWRIGSGMSEPEPKKPKNPFRRLTGVVYAQGTDNPVPRALVTLKNTKTLAVKTFIADEKGSYQFAGLSPNVDYEIYAESAGVRSSTRTLSSFDNREKPSMDLRIPARTKAEAPKEESKK
jgi:Carboxypeptidase regulatory-like domain